MTPDEALQRLRAGNRRFAAGQCTRNVSEGHRLCVEPSGGLMPFAVVLGCSDSRVPLELIFDQGFGDLFVIRVAGNVIGPTLIGSVEFAATRFGTPLVVVLGHSRCGAVTVTVDELLDSTGSESPNLESVMSQIRPSARKVIDSNSGAVRDEIIRMTVRENIRSSSRTLLQESSLLSGLVSAGQFRIVCAKYSLDTGIVDFFE